MKNYPVIRAYHPEIPISDGKRHYVLKADSPDWVPDDEVVAAAASAVGASTAGELVEKLCDGHKCATGELVNVRVERLSQARSPALPWNASV